MLTVDGVMELSSGFTPLRAGSKPNLCQSPFFSGSVPSGWVVVVVADDEVLVPCWMVFELADSSLAQLVNIDGVTSSTNSTFCPVPTVVIRFEAFRKGEGAVQQRRAHLLSDKSIEHMLVRALALYLNRVSVSLHLP